MLSLLGNIIEFIKNIPQYILYAAETVINSFFAALEAAWIAVSSLIALPGVPGPPEFIHEINWFFPVGAVIAVMGPIVTGFIIWLGIKWLYTKLGNI